MKAAHKAPPEPVPADADFPVAELQYTDLDRTLAWLRSVQPRPGVEGRMLAQLRHAPVRRVWAFALPYPSPRLVMPVLCLTAAALFAAAGLEYRNLRREPAFVPAHLAVQMAEHGVAASAAVAIAQTPIHAAARGRSRRLHAGRAQHGRALLPRGVAAPLQRDLRFAPAH